MKCFSKTVLGATVALGSFGCGAPSDAVVAQCVDQCELAGDCPGGSGDCLAACEDERTFAKRVDCTPSYEALLDCIDTLADPCDLTSCGDAVNLYSLCIGDYCSANPTDEICPQ